MPTRGQGSDTLCLPSQRRPQTPLPKKQIPSTFIVMPGGNVKLDIAGKYIRLPKYGDKGHKTQGNWYTSILNAYGNPIEHYGAFDTGLNKFELDQSGPIKQFLG
jgi:hypothetical protein